MTKKEKIFYVFLAVFVVLYLTLFLNCFVPTESMDPTLTVHSRYLTFKQAYRFDEPKQGDIVCFKCPDTEVFYVKRIIGLPGQMIHSRNGYISVEVNPRCSVYLDEDYVKNGRLDDDWDLYIPKAGDQVTVNDGSAYINDICVGQADLFLEEYCDSNDVVIEDTYLMLGDNRAHSEDARFWQHHYVKKSRIKSKFIFCYFSKDIKNIGFVH